MPREVVTRAIFANGPSSVGWWPAADQGSERIVAIGEGGCIHLLNAKDLSSVKTIECEKIEGEDTDESTISDYSAPLVIHPEVGNFKQLKFGFAYLHEL